MADIQKLNRWAELLLDTGKRNNMINFRDTKLTTAEVILPDAESLFSKCSLGRTFEVYDPKIDYDEELPDEPSTEKKALTREEYIETYSPKIKKERLLLMYALSQNPIKTIRRIAAKSRDILEETGSNVTHFAFGFLKWKDKETSDRFYHAPLLLLHVNVIVGSVLESIKIQISDEDVIVNPTFKFLLEAEYGLSLPDFEEDKDTLTSYYAKVAKMITGTGWEIVNECKLGIFSFLKINMYEDLKNNGELILANENVRALLGEPVVESGLMGTLAKTRRVNNPLIELHTVVDADSSQIEAIEMAKSGKSFVLQGPPGTGKSQTITNIIAECLYDGKKVLFVSEKQAALNVVYSKLKRAGLEDFCLELHSHKANKKEVIEELNRVLESPRSKVLGKAQEEIRQKLEAQTKLDSYAFELHKERGIIKKSLFQLFEAFSATRDFPDVDYEIASIQTKDQEYLRKAVSLLEQYVEYVPTIGEDYHKNAWFGFHNTSITFEERNQLKADLELLSRGYKDLHTKTIQTKERYEVIRLNFKDTQKWRDFLSFLASSDVVTPGVLSENALSFVMPHIAEMKGLSDNINRYRNNLLQRYSEDIIHGVNGKEFYTKLSGQYASGLSRMFSGEYKNIIATLKIYALNGQKPKYQQALECTSELMLLQAAMHSFNEHEQAVGRYLGPGYQGYLTKWNQVFGDLAVVKNYLNDKDVEFGNLPQMSPSEYQENRWNFQKDLEEINNEMILVHDAKARVSEQFYYCAIDLDRSSYEQCLNKINTCLAEFDYLGNWNSFSILLKQIDDQNLRTYIDYSIENKTAISDIVGAYRRVFYRHWIEYVIFSVAEFASFTRIKQDQAVENFCSKDELQYSISTAQIKAKLSKERPELDLVAGGSDVAILRREGQKKRRQMPVRKLLKETGELIQIIKPCFLMSPLSVSTYLDPEVVSFDTIVFDEASQIFPQDAIGAIYRGKQLIVVGDSKQMPPTDFFTSTVDVEDEDEEVGDVADFESILDICSAIFTTERLLWHYRSHYEQLIAFSNLHFYRNTLLTFPSTDEDHPGIGVDYYHVDGIFDRKSKTNRKEAEAVVDLIYKHFEEYPNRSLGVVAFSASQQGLIENLLLRRRMQDPSYESFFKEDIDEPFFIKNLESVQGDERDTIIFSIAYAPDMDGRFIHNFGPLNRVGGERRLNVAITRAKDNVQIVSSIHYTDIDLNRTKSEGARLLRAYLDYAQNGEIALERELSVEDNDQFDSDLELEVCEFLRANGFSVDTQVGCSGYKIDLGLKRSEDSDYVLAIECDGATYHSSKNARDRDRLRQQVLENMGWKFYRVWSTDWFKNQAVEKERLLAAAQEAVAMDPTIPSEPETVTESVEKPEEPPTVQFIAEVQGPKVQFPEYQCLNALEVLDKYPYRNVKKALRDILEIEAPLSEDFLLRRICRYYGREKVTSIVMDSFHQDIKGFEAEGIIFRKGYYYLEGRDKFVLRVPGYKREIKHIAPEELASGLYTIISQNVSVSVEGLYKTLTSILGFNRTGDAIELKYDKAFQILLDHKMVVRDEDGNVSVRGQIS